MERCDYPLCRKSRGIGYVGGKSLCDEHWLKLAMADEAMETIMLANLGLARVAGEVVRQPKTNVGQTSTGV